MNRIMVILLGITTFILATLGLWAYVVLLFIYFVPAVYCFKWNLDYEMAHFSYLHDDGFVGVARVFGSIIPGLNLCVFLMLWKKRGHL